MSVTSRFFSLIMAGCAFLGKARGTRIMLMLLFFMTLGGAGFYALYSLSAWTYDTVSAKIAHKLDVRITNVIIQGAKDIDISETLERHNLNIGSIVTDIDWQGVKRDLLQNPMIVRADIIRKSPQDVQIRLQPRKPIARIDRRSADAHETVLVDRSGHKIRVSGQSGDKNLIAISGTNAFKEIDGFWPILMAEPAVAREIAAASYVGKRRWDLTMKSGAKVQLPQDDVGLAMKHLSRLYTNTGFDPNSVRTIDLRAGDRLYLRTNSITNIEKPWDVQTKNQG